MIIAWSRIDNWNSRNRKNWFPTLPIDFCDDRLIYKKSTALNCICGTTNYSTLVDTTISWLLVYFLFVVIHIFYNNSLIYGPLVFCRYRENMKILSDTMKDVPISPSESVVYWTNYVLRHNGALHLRTVGADMPLYQYLMLDVIGFIAAVIISSFCLLICLCKRIFKICFPAMKSVEAKKKRQWKDNFCFS